jgi:hypothetical protein
MWIKRTLVIALSALTFIAVDSAPGRALQPASSPFLGFVVYISVVSVLAAAIFKFDRYLVPCWTAAGLFLGVSVQSTMIDPERYALPFVTLAMGTIAAVVSLLAGYFTIAVREIFFFRPKKESAMPTPHPYRRASERDEERR